MIRLIVPAGKAAPAPPVGPALGQKVRTSVTQMLTAAASSLLCVSRCIRLTVSSIVLLDFKDNGFLT